MTSEIVQAKAALRAIENGNRVSGVRCVQFRVSELKEVIKALQAMIDADMHKHLTCSENVLKKDTELNKYKRTEIEPFEPDPEYMPVIPGDSATNNN